MGYEEGFDASSIYIPAVFVSSASYLEIKDLLTTSSTRVTSFLNTHGQVYLASYGVADWFFILMPVMMGVCLICSYLKRYVDARFARVERTVRTRDLPMVEYRKVSENPNENSPDVGGGAAAEGPTRIHNESCAICLDDFTEGCAVKVLPCAHGFHNECIGMFIIVSIFIYICI